MTNSLLRVHATSGYPPKPVANADMAIGLNHPTRAMLHTPAATVRNVINALTKLEWISRMRSANQNSSREQI
jgi:hypothetical protein